MASNIAVEHVDCEEFNSDKFKLEYFDNEFDQFVGLDHIASLADVKDRKLKIKSSPVVPVASNVNIQVPNRGEMNQQVQQDAELDAVQDHEDFEIHGNPQRRLHWPHPFIIRDDLVRGGVVLTKLNRGDELTTGDRTILFTGLYDESQKFAIYPSRQQYNDMVHALLNRWPYLHSKCGYAYAVISWKNKMRSFFKNSRKRIPSDKRSDLQRAMAQRFNTAETKKAAADNENLIKKANRNLPNDITNRCAGEDEHSIAKHIDRLQVQFHLTSSRRSEVQIETSMGQTFPDRRTLIVKELRPINEVVLIYPLLTEGEQLLLEFQRLLQWDIKDSFVNSFKEMAPKILKIRNIKVTFQTKDLVEKARDLAEDEEALTYNTMCAALLALPLFVKEKPRSLFLTSELSSVPQLISSKPIEELHDVLDNDIRWSVMVEGNEVGETNDFIMAFLYMFACYYIFDLAYPSCLKGTLVFVQKHILKIGDTSSILPKLIGDLDGV